MNFQKAKFKKGVVGEDPILYDKLPQIAFIGRSNVGKSTTINRLLERKKLVKTGKTPGKTKEINFFELVYKDKAIYFVDLPGYGYAKLSKQERKKLEELIFWYLGNKDNTNLRLIVLILDAKAGLTEFDREVIHFLAEKGRAFILAINKVDKVNQKQLAQLKKDIKEIIPELELNQNIFYYSAIKGKNLHRLREVIISALSS